MDIPLNVAMIHVKHELKAKIRDIRKEIPVPPYIINAVLAEISSELKDEEKDLLTIMLMQGGQNGKDTNTKSDT